MTIKDKPTVIPSSGPTTRSQFNAFLHALELDEEAPEERKETVNEQVAALSETETEDEVQYDSKPVEDDASEGVPEEASEVAILSPARVPTDIELVPLTASFQKRCMTNCKIHQSWYPLGVAYR